MIVRRGTAATRTLVGLALVAASVVAWSGQALATHSVEFAIVLSDEQDCNNGSDVLRMGAARPFDVEVCVAQDDVPIEGHSMTAMITHGDDSLEELPLVTDGAGEAAFTVTPRAPGGTEVEICDADGCVYGSVEMSADQMPPPPPVASYTGPTSDMGPSEPIIDEVDDFIDATTGRPAPPGSGDPAFDIESVQYLGVLDGAATFEFGVLGDACGPLEDGAPIAQVSVHIGNPDESSYDLFYSRSADGELFSNASSEGAPLDDVTVDLSCTRSGVSGFAGSPGQAISTVLLWADGADVQLGSNIIVQFWLSLGDESSGFRDFVEAILTALQPPPTEAAAPPTAGPPSEPATVDDGSSETGEQQSDGDGGSTTNDEEGSEGGGTDPGDSESDGSGLTLEMLLALLILLLLLLALLAWLAYLWWLRHSQPVPAQDRPPPPEKPLEPDDPEFPTVLEGVPVDTPSEFDAYPGYTFEDPCWEQQRSLDSRQDRLRTLEAELQEVDPSSATYAELQTAIAHTTADVAAAQQQLDECIGALSPETPSGGGPGTAPPPPAPITFSKDCKDEEAAYAAAKQRTERAKERRGRAQAAWLEADARSNALENRVGTVLVEPHRDTGYPEGSEFDAAFAEDMVQYEVDRAALQEAAGQVAEAHRAEAAALAERDAAIAEQSAAMSAENAARLALDACLGQSSSPTDDGDDGDDGDGGDEGGGVTGGELGGAAGGAAGGELGGGSPGTAPPPDEPPETDPECTGNETKWVKEGADEVFTFAESVTVRISNAPAPFGAWITANGGNMNVNQNALAGLDGGELAELLEPLPEYLRVIPAAAVHVKTIKLFCERLFECQGGRWVKTEQTRKNEVVVSVDIERFGGRPAPNVAKIYSVTLKPLKARLKALDSASVLADAKAFTCD